MRKFTKIIIANRGEIAVRIIRACHEMGIKAVAVYSEADAAAMHVREADEAYPIGPAPATASYLKGEALVETALKAGCQAVHPGYGFLAENADFAQMVTDAGLVYIGSSAKSIRLLGDKTESRRVMHQAGVPIVPGSDLFPPDTSPAQAAERIGFPVLVKAAGGGGGKGMRVVRSPEELSNALEAASREAKAAFGNPAVYIEKYLENPRHIEFQVFGDTHGNRVHLFERECSIQRRHQKIVEETPSVILDSHLRTRMGRAAVRAAEAAGYYNAGTVEFLLDRSGNFYFLEVNTRIQVEHPVTESVVGVDLVREQIRAAMGCELPWSQTDLIQRGHAIECRIYAEDPANGFLPQAGKVLFLKEPTGPGIRWDGGVESGDEVTVHYDPIMAKLIAWGTDRTSALRRMRTALDRTVILGIVANVEFLKAVIDHPEFVRGNLHTGFLNEHFPDWRPPVPEDLGWESAVISISGRPKAQSTGDGAKLPDPWLTVGGWEIASGNK